MFLAVLSKLSSASELVGLALCEESSRNFDSVLVFIYYSIRIALSSA